MTKKTTWVIKKELKTSWNKAAGLTIKPSPWSINYNEFGHSTIRINASGAYNLNKCFAVQAVFELLFFRLGKTIQQWIHADGQKAQL